MNLSQNMKNNKDLSCYENRIIAQEYNMRMKQCVNIASDRGYEALIVIGKGPERSGDLIYLINHVPLLPGHPRRYSFRGRGYSALVIPLDKEPALAVTTPFYEDSIYIDNIFYNNNIIISLKSILQEMNLLNADIGFVGTDIFPISLYWDMIKYLPNVKFYPADDIVMNLRAIKSDYEKEIIKMGALIADSAVSAVMNYISPGKTELEVANLIISVLKSKGVESPFATCQSGERSKEPYSHIPASEKVIQNGDMVHFEINGRYKNYLIDVCRSTVVGDIVKEQEFILEITLKILEETINVMKPGVIAESLEEIAAEIVSQYGLEVNFTAAYGGPGTYLGHGIGVGVDEPPIIAKGDKTILKPGMVITIEPGIYRTAWGGCRIEDEVLITEEGCEVLNKSDRRLWN